MGDSFQVHKLEKFIIDDSRFLFTLTSYVSILITFINLNTLKSSILGVVAFVLYFLINGIFLSHAFFEKEDAFFRLMFGVLLLIMLLGFVGWLIMIIYNLDVPELSLVLFIVTSFSSLICKRVKNKNAA